MELSCENCVNEKVVHKGKYDIFLECQDCFRGCSDKLDGCCVAPDLININMPRTDGKPTKRNYCKRCGNVSAMVKIENPDEWKSLPVVTRDYANTVSQNRYKRQSSFYAYLRNKKSDYFESKRDEHTKKYHAYLETMEWADKRKRVLNRDNYECQACLINKATQVHHLTYDRVFKEPLFDLTSVCNECHKNIHDIDIKLLAGTDEEQIRNFEISKLVKVFGL